MYLLLLFALSFVDMFGAAETPSFLIKSYNHVAEKSRLLTKVCGRPADRLIVFAHISSSDVSEEHLAIEFKNGLDMTQGDLIVMALTDYLAGLIKTKAIRISEGTLDWNACRDLHVSLPILNMILEESDKSHRQDVSGYVYACAEKGQEPFVAHVRRESEKIIPSQIISMQFDAAEVTVTMDSGSQIKVIKQHVN